MIASLTPLKTTRNERLTSCQSAARAAGQQDWPVKCRTTAFQGEPRHSSPNAAGAHDLASGLERLVRINVEALLLQLLHEPKLPALPLVGDVDDSMNIRGQFQLPMNQREYTLASEFADEVA